MQCLKFPPGDFPVFVSFLLSPAAVPTFLKCPLNQAVLWLESIHMFLQIPSSWYNRFQITSTEENSRMVDGSDLPWFDLWLSYFMMVQSYLEFWIVIFSQARGMWGEALFRCWAAEAPSQPGARESKRWTHDTGATIPYADCHAVCNLRYSVQSMAWSSDFIISRLCVTWFCLTMF